MTLGIVRILEIVRGSTRPHCFESWHW